MLKNQKVKKTVKFKDLVIKLYEYDLNNYESFSNIEAFDKKGNLLWQAEKPLRHYWDMQIDEDNNQLEANSGSGRIYTIDLTNGHIIESFLVK